MPEEKLIWMPLYIRDIRADTTRLNATLYGAYMSLIEEEFLHGPLPNDLGVLCHLARLYSSHDAPLDFADTPSITPSIPQVLPEHVISTLLSQFFVLGADNLWRQKRVEIERTKALNLLHVRREKGRNAIAARWRKRALSISPGNTLSISPGNTPSISPSNTEFTGSTRDYDSLRSSPSLPNGAPAPRGGFQNPPSPTGKPPARGKQNEIKAKPSKKGPGRIANGGDNETRMDSSGKRALVGLRSGAGHPKKQLSRPKADLPVDSRFEPFRGELSQCWVELNIGMEGAGDCPWGVKDQAALLGMLRACPEMTLETFRILLMNRAHSEGILSTDPPRNWVSVNLKRYINGPLDRYNKPIKRGREY
jgi:uncharacterized protein YdaU (DUF1376 family)